MQKFICYGFLLFVIFGTMDVFGQSPHLVTVSKKELLTIMTCINNLSGKYSYFCRRFEDCDRELPEKAYRGYSTCLAKFPKEGPENRKCGHGMKMFSTMKIPAYIYDCMSEIVPPYNYKERRQVRNFEECIRKLYSQSCAY